MPDAGQGARKLKSYMFAGGAIEMKPRISGRRISSCMPIQAPKLTPATQVASASGWICCTQSSAEAASLSSPMPLSNVPWLLPTPRKLKRSVAKPRRTKVLVEQLDDLVVHRPAGLRVAVQDQRDRRARTRPRVEAALETAFGSGKNDFGHGRSLRRIETECPRKGCTAAAAPI